MDRGWNARTNQQIIMQNKTSAHVPSDNRTMTVQETLANARVEMDPLPARNLGFYIVSQPAEQRWPQLYLRRDGRWTLGIHSSDDEYYWPTKQEAETSLAEARAKATPPERSPAIPTDMNGIQQIAAERTRQIEDEKWTQEHDAEHVNAEMVEAAIGYAEAAGTQVRGGCGWRNKPENWPWHAEWWKPSDDPIRNLVKAGALIAAEIDRIQRNKP